MPTNCVDDLRDRILCGDALETLKTLPDECVDCVISSPPYYGLRVYDVDREIGLESTVEEYVGKLVCVFREVRRVLKPWGVLWLNLGSSYAGSWGNYHPNSPPGKHGQRLKETARWNRPAYESQEFRPPTATLQNWKPKDLIPTAWLVGLALRNDGWWLRSDCIWEKPNCMPSSVSDRPTISHEYVLLLSRSERYFYDNDAVREPTIPDPRDKLWGKTRTGSRHDHKKDRQMGMSQTRTQADGFVSMSNPLGRNLRTVWTIPTQSFPESHFATFPEALAERCIKAGTSEKGNCAQCGKPWVRSGRLPQSVLGEALRILREKQGLSRQQVAEMCHKGENNIWDWEEGGHIPSETNWILLSKALKIPFDRSDFIEKAEYIVTGSQDGPKRRLASHDPLVNRPYSERKIRLATFDCTWRPSCNCGCETTTRPIVLDPFGGACTTALVAKKLNRDFIMIELKPEYCEMGRQRLLREVPLLLQNTEVLR